MVNKQETSSVHQYSYDANGNLLYVNTGTKTTDGKLQATNTRKLLWDEENRLLALSDNGFVSNYWYDAAGERTVKQSGDGEEISVNGMLSGGRTGTTKYTAYISPYFVGSNGGNFSKHIYIGSQRIVSKLFNSSVFGGETPITEDPALNKNFMTKYNLQTENIKTRFDSLGVSFNGTLYKNETNTAAIGVIDGGSSTMTPINYYFHSDHLGSSSLITNQSGDVVQHLEYIPFGEVFIDERPSAGSWSTPYKFNAKELDEETGMYYYGARYYDPRTSVWISVDPLEEKFPNFSSYVYCYNSPVRYIDPDGRYGSDGHYWTVYAAALSMGVSNTNSVQLALHAENYDNVVENANNIQNTQFYDNFTWMPYLETQKTQHGLTGGSQLDVLMRALNGINNGDLDFIHLLGDAFAHATEESGYTKMYSPPMGHARYNADNINEHQGQYKKYLGYLEKVIQEYTGSYKKIDMNVFTTIMNIDDSNLRTEVFKCYIASKTSHSYTTSTYFNKNKISIMSESLKKIGVKYNTSTFSGTTFTISGTDNKTKGSNP